MRGRDRLMQMSLKIQQAKQRVCTLERSVKTAESLSGRSELSAVDALAVLDTDPRVDHWVDGEACRNWLREYLKEAR
jgi:hypothetical protein